MSGTNSLLADFVRDGSEKAFRELVAGYFDLVYSTAIRLVAGDKHLAEDVSQHVFIDLARKAVGLPEDIQLGGWLHRHTYFLACKAMRGERRRKARERQAMELQTLGDYSEENLLHVTVVLDEVINELGAEERAVILLRFFEKLDFQTVGGTLGCSEDAARMRVSRALEKLGSSLRRRGFVLSAAGLAYVIGTKTTTAAPVGLAAKVSHIGFALASKAGNSLAMIKAACLTKLNIGLVSAAAAVALITLVIAKSQSGAGLEFSSQPNHGALMVGTAQVKHDSPLATPPGGNSAPSANPAGNPPRSETAANKPTGAGSVKPLTVQTTTASAQPTAPPPTTPAPVATVDENSKLMVAAAALLNRLPGGPNAVPSSSLPSQSQKSAASVSNLLMIALASRSLANNTPQGSALGSENTTLPPQRAGTAFFGQTIEALVQSAKVINEAVADEDSPAEKSLPAPRARVDPLTGLKQIKALLDEP